MANCPDKLTECELEEVTAVFKTFETGLREATIHPSDLHKAMKRLGLNPTDQDVVDIPMQIGKKGLIYFPEFCQMILERFRKDVTNDGDVDEVWRQNLFKVSEKPRKVALVLVSNCEMLKINQCSFCHHHLQFQLRQLLTVCTVK